MFGKAKRRKGTEFIKEVPMGTNDMDVLDKLWGSQADVMQQAKAQRLEELRTEEQYKKYAQQAYGQQLANQAAGTIPYTTTSTASSATLTALQMQQAQQLGNAYGSGTVSIPSVWTTSPNTVQYPGTPTPTDEPTEFRQLVLLQVINLITNVGPSTTKKLLRRFKIDVKPSEVDDIYKDMSKVFNNDDDPELDKVINDAVKEVKL
jgi:hypothetical protein